MKVKIYIFRATFSKRFNRTGCQKLQHSNKLIKNLYPNKCINMGAVGNIKSIRYHE